MQKSTYTWVSFSNKCTEKKFTVENLDISRIQEIYIDSVYFITDYNLIYIIPIL